MNCDTTWYGGIECFVLYSIVYSITFDVSPASADSNSLVRNARSSAIFAFLSSAVIVGARFDFEDTMVDRLVLRYFLWSWVWPSLLYTFFLNLWV